MYAMAADTESGPAIAPGSPVELHLSLRLGDGTVAISTFDEEPLRLRVGDGSLTPGLEEPLIGLRAGSGFELLLPADQGYGPRDEDNIHSLSRSDFPPELELAPGVVVQFTTPGGQEVAGTILELGEAEVQVDFNHPLAGRELWYRVQILAVGNAEPGNTD